MKIALLQIDPTVGDIEGNAALLAEAAAVAARAGADLAVASELSLLGYPPRDLLLRRSFVARGWTVCEELARSLAAGPPLLLGLAVTNEGAGKPLYNAAALLAGGTVRRVFRKTLLPTYDVFDEDRYFEPFHGPQVLESGTAAPRHQHLRRRLERSRLLEAAALSPRSGRGPRGAPAPRCIVNLSASPFSVGKQCRREEMLGSHRAQARRAGRLCQPVRRQRRSRLRRPQLRL